MANSHSQFLFRSFRQRVPNCDRRVAGLTLVLPIDSHNYFHFVMRALHFLYQSGYDGQIDHLYLRLSDEVSPQRTTGLFRQFSTLSESPLSPAFQLILRSFTKSGSLIYGDGDTSSAAVQMLCFDHLVPRAVQDQFGIDVTEPVSCTTKEKLILASLTTRFSSVLLSLYPNTPTSIPQLLALNPPGQQLLLPSSVDACFTSSDSPSLPYCAQCTANHPLLYLKRPLSGLRRVKNEAFLLEALKEAGL
jgi:hypothetical protein